MVALGVCEHYWFGTHNAKKKQQRHLVAESLVQSFSF